jgi:hypothetical protein
MEAPLSVLALRLIALRAAFGKTVEVALIELFLVYGGRDHVFETRIAQRRRIHIRPPGNRGFLLPLLSTPNTLYAQFVHTMHPAQRHRRILCEAVKVE